MPVLIEEKQFETLHAVPCVTGYIENNNYILYDESSRDCVIIDPSFNFDTVLALAEQIGVTPREYWLTHGHFDHYMGTGYPESLALGITTHMHPLDQPLFEEGIARMSRSFPLMKNCPQPLRDLEDGKELHVGSYTFTTLFTPGHAPGHCCFYCARAGWLFSGDLVFYHSYGRTDLTGGNEAALMKSICERVLTLPPETLILPGHNDFTTVRSESVFYQ